MCLLFPPTSANLARFAKYYHFSRHGLILALNFKRRFVETLLYAQYKAFGMHICLLVIEIIKLKRRDKHECTLCYVYYHTTSIPIYLAGGCGLVFHKCFLLLNFHLSEIIYCTLQRKRSLT